LTFEFVRVEKYLNNGIDILKFSPFAFLQIVLSHWLSREEGASAPSSFSLPFRHLPLYHPSLHASFEANFASQEALSASFEVLFASFEVLSTLSLFNSTINLALAPFRLPQP
jgi:hypothetical protein